MYISFFIALFPVKCTKCTVSNTDICVVYITINNIGYDSFFCFFSSLVVAIMRMFCHVDMFFILLFLSDNVFNCFFVCVGREGSLDSLERKICCFSTSVNSFSFSERLRLFKCVILFEMERNMPMIMAKRVTIREVLLFLIKGP